MFGEGILVRPSSETRWQVEEESTKYIIELLESMGYEILEVYLHKPNPYDIKARAPDGSVKYIEVKGHKPLVFTASLDDRQTRFGEEHPEDYIVCVVANMAKPREQWRYICKPYRD